MELCRGGELLDLLRKKGYFREEVCVTEEEGGGGVITILRMGGRGYDQFDGVE